MPERICIADYSIMNNIENAGMHSVNARRRSLCFKSDMKPIIYNLFF